ncbi:Demethylspheroidene O-methyltransferase [Roseovarius gaetbuli]|uniref:Demethylspheroidene O-methyltransferase n=1 Tax=Roseovarius gaetbuli TaxID=1356575 RepID=A0A1X6ZQ54_9RHOB|nr:Demethylspheroidene O-methyltransferase [Roseovarius gaetbuli]
MATGDLPETPARPKRGPGGWITRLIARPGFQRWASGFPLTRGVARRDGAAIFDIVQGFVQSQVLSALVELEVFQRLAEAPHSARDLGPRAGVPEEHMQILLQAGAALGLLKGRRDGRFALSRRGGRDFGRAGA